MGEQYSTVTPHNSNITNLCSSLKLNNFQREILEKGLTFIPTPRPPDRTQLLSDLHTYHRRLKILDHFHYNSDYPHVPFTNKSIKYWVHLAKEHCDFTALLCELLYIFMQTNCI